MYQISPAWRSSFRSQPKPMNIHLSEAKKADLAFAGFIPRSRTEHTLAVLETAYYKCTGSRYSVLILHVFPAYLCQPWDLLALLRRNGMIPSPWVRGSWSSLEWHTQPQWSGNLSLLESHLSLLVPAIYMQHQLNKFNVSNKWIKTSCNFSSITFDYLIIISVAQHLNRICC